MPTDKKTTTNKPKSKQTKPIQETKEQTFLRIATSRVSNVLKALRILGNCSNRNNYSYTKEQIDSMVISISEALENMIMKFSPSKDEQQTFEF